MPTYPSVTLSRADQLTLHFEEFGQKRLNAQAWPRSPMLDILLRNSKPYEGGEYITEIIEDGYEPTGTAIGEGSDIPVTQHNISLPASYQPRLVEEDAYLDGFRMKKIETQGSMGPLVSWAESQAGAAMRRCRENFARYIAAASTTAAANGATPPQSIFDIIKTSGTVGGIDPGQFAWWASSGDDTTTWSSGGPAQLRTLLRETRRYTGFAGPNVMFASKTTIDQMKAGGYAKTTFMRPPDVAKGYDLGDGHTTPDIDPDCYFDNIPIWYDSHLDAREADLSPTGGVLIGFNTEAIYLKMHPGFTFQMDPWKDSHGKFGIFARVFAMGELCAKNRSASFIMKGIS